MNLFNEYAEFLLQTEQRIMRLAEQRDQALKQVKELEEIIKNVRLPDTSKEGK